MDRRAHRSHAPTPEKRERRADGTMYVPGCPKKAYPTMKSARAAADYARKSTMAAGRTEWVVAYKCHANRPKHFHIGHPPGLNTIPTKDTA